MRIHVITPPGGASTPGPSGKTAGLAHGGDALLRGGIVEELSAAGINVTGVTQPRLSDDHLTADPIRNLGRYNRLIADAVADAAAQDAAPLLLGGTCSHLVGMLAGFQRVHGPAARIGLVWFDAHGDFNTPRTTRSGMLGGMPVATAAGLCHATWREEAGQAASLPTDRILFVDVRNLDPEEATLIAATDARIARFGPDEATSAIGDAARELAQRVDHLYLHVDADVLDLSLQPNHPTAEPNGPGLAPTTAAIAAVMRTGKVRAFAVVSVNPDGPRGATSLSSARALLRGGVAAWGSGQANDV